MQCLKLTMWVRWLTYYSWPKNKALLSPYQSISMNLTLSVQSFSVPTSHKSYESVSRGCGWQGIADSNEDPTEPTNNIFHLQSTNWKIKIEDCPSEVYKACVADRCDSKYLMASGCWYPPGTLNNQFFMDVWLKDHFPCKDVESSNWNNHKELVVWSSRQFS